MIPYSLYISSPSRDSHYAQTHTGHREIYNMTRTGF